MAVAVTLGFPSMDHTGDELEREVRDQVGDLLNGLSARTVEETLEIVTRDDGTVLSFTLVGENKIDVASHLEDMVTITLTHRCSKRMLSDSFFVAVHFIKGEIRPLDA